MAIITPNIDQDKKDFLDNINIMIGEMDTIIAQSLPRTDVKQDTCINYLANNLKRTLKLMKKIINHEIS